MNRNSRHILIISIAVATAALASLGVYRAVTQIPVREVEVARSFVVVAARSLPPGVRVTAADVRLAAWPQSSPVPGSFSNVDEVVNRALLASVVENEPLVQGKLASSEAGAGLTPSIPPGMRAMSVKVNDVIGVAGYIDPGTRVDLVVTMRRRDESTSRTVVSNVQVLSAGTRHEQEKARFSPTQVATAVASLVVAPPAVVTLLVTPNEAERIALAQAEGQIMLVLRNPLDTETTTTSGVRTAALLAGETPPPAPPVNRVVQRRPAVAPPPPPIVAAAAPAPPKPYTVEAIRAAKRTEEVVQETGQEQEPEVAR
jgi:pilus assembly protein CpaB